MTPSQGIASAESGSPAEHDDVVVRAEEFEKSGDLGAVTNLSTHLHRSRIGPEDPSADAQQGGLTGAVLTGERDDLAGLDREIDSVQNRRRSVPLADPGRDKLTTAGCRVTRGRGFLQREPWPSNRA